MKLTTVLGGVLAAGFVGYCFYFDQQRRSAPGFRKKLIAKRRKEYDNIVQQNEKIKEAEKRQTYVNAEIKEANECIRQGDNRDAAIHFYNAYKRYTHPEKLLEMVKTTCPDEVYVFVLDLVQKAKSRHQSESAQADLNAPPPP